MNDLSQCRKKPGYGINTRISPVEGVGIFRPWLSSICFLPDAVSYSLGDSSFLLNVLKQNSSPWYVIGFSLAAGIIIIFLIYIMLLRKLIRDKTNSLQESEEKYRRFFMTSKDPVFITTKDGKWIDANQATVELFGYKSKKDLLATSVSQAYLKPDERLDTLKDIERTRIYQ